MRSVFAKRSLSGLLACENPEDVKWVLDGLTPKQVIFLGRDWQFRARDDQLPPAENWATWAILGGRGAGKTRAGAEWVRAMALGELPVAKEPASRIALIGETLGDVRSVMIEGVSGLLAVHKPEERPVFEPSKRQLLWRNGTVAQMFSAEDPDSLRGPQFAAAWLDELAKYPNARDVWDMLQFCLRIGHAPRQVITTTPRPLPLLKEIMAAPGTVVTRAATSANAAHLAPAFLESIVARYGGTRLGRQELDAEILEDRPDTLWPRALIERCRVRHAPPLERIVVAVDPPVTSSKHSDACGLVVAGRSGDRAYVLADLTLDNARPAAWARAAARAYHRYGADRLVAEVNQGGDMVESVIRQVDATIAIRKARASRGKWLRAEPVSALYEQGRVRHAGAFPELEDQMADFGPDGLSGGGSPDRLDALVWALTDLMLRSGANPRVRTL